jgi:hypothetical protein
MRYVMHLPWEVWNRGTDLLLLRCEFFACLLCAEETCDLFTGAWVEDDSPPLYTNENCPIVTQTQNCPGNGRPDSNYLNWRWQPQGCDLPAFDAKAFLELMRGKTLAFVGDSVARNQYESLLCMLWQVNFLVTRFFHSNLLHHLPIMSGMLRCSSSSSSS